MSRPGGRWLGPMIGISLGFASVTAPAGGMVERETVQRFIMEMTEEHGFPAAMLQRLFADTEPDENVLALIRKPAEKKEWGEYRPIFVTDRNTAEGRRFMRRHAAALIKAEATYGVPAPVITAIVGVETRYGTNTGSHNVFRSLATIAFYYPKRADFFRRELIQFLLLTQELGLPPDQFRGSYAGAMGIPQFLASSYRHYAVDFDGDGRVDIWRNVTDSIGSIANYLNRHGWTLNGDIARRVFIDDVQWRRLTMDGDRVPVTRLRRAGVIDGPDDVTGSERRLIRLMGVDIVEYWMADGNFDVITKYNHSDLYALAVFQLAESISSTQEEIVDD